jgi:hypothetical protein
MAVGAGGAAVRGFSTAAVGGADVGESVGDGSVTPGPGGGAGAGAGETAARFGDVGAGSGVIIAGSGGSGAGTGDITAGFGGNGAGTGTRTGTGGAGAGEPGTLGDVVRESTFVCVAASAVSTASARRFRRAISSASDLTSSALSCWETVARSRLVAS